MWIFNIIYYTLVTFMPDMVVNGVVTQDSLLYRFISNTVMDDLVSPIQLWVNPGDDSVTRTN